MAQTTTNRAGTQKPSIKRINEIGLAYQQSGTIWAALELGLFTAISEGAAGLTDIARGIRVDEDATERLLTACLALNLVISHDGEYANAPDVERFLVRGKPHYHGDWVLNHKRQYEQWKDLAQAVRPGSYRWLWEDPKFAREYTEMGYRSSITAGQKLAREIDFSPFSLLLDIGGGSGVYSIMATQANPQLKAIVFDHPNVCAVADDFITLAGLQERVRTIPGNYVTDDYPATPDVILICGTLEPYNTDVHRQVLGRAFRTLQPGGTLILIINMLEEDRSGPFEAVFSNLQQVANRESRGRIHTPQELDGLLKSAGFSDLVFSDFVPGTYRRICAKKPV